MDNHFRSAFGDEIRPYEEASFTWLGPADLFAPDFAWHSTPDGTLLLLRCLENGRYQLADGRLYGAVKLNNIADAMMYVEHAAKSACKSEDKLRALLNLSGAVCLSICPNLNVRTTGSGETKNLLQAFCESVELWSPSAAGRLLAECIYNIGASSNRAMIFIRQCLSSMHEEYLGMLCAHGLVSRRFWQERHQEALIQGWRFQLRNPGLLYGSSIGGANPGENKCLIERDISLEDKSQLLAATGLKTEDLHLALEVASLMPPDDRLLRTEALLTFLGPRSILRIPQKRVTDYQNIDFLTDF